VVADTRGPEGNAPPLEFNTGMGQVPEALDMAVKLMTPQELSLVRAASRYAFDGRADRPEVCLLSPYLPHLPCFGGRHRFFLLFTLASRGHGAHKEMSSCKPWPDTPLTSGRIGPRRVCGLIVPDYPVLGQIHI
jgi:hypothetical protein